MWGLRHNKKHDKDKMNVCCEKTKIIYNALKQHVCIYTKK